MSRPVSGGEAGIAVVGGGLAGLSAAVALSGAKQRVELFESRHRLGGRAASFRDPTTGDLVDHCQHVSMGCCTNLADFCRRTGLGPFFRREDKLHFIGPDSVQYTLQAARWLPAPLHLAPAFWRMRYLSMGDRWRIARAVWRLARTSGLDRPDSPTIGAWLLDQGQSPRAIEQFWGVILTSALGETLDRASLAAARKVFVDGFLAARRAYELEVPQAPLGELYGERLCDWLVEHGVDLRLGTAIKQLRAGATARWQLELADGNLRAFDRVIVALPWRQAATVFAPELQVALPFLADVDRIEGAPISAVHLWFDRPLTGLPHAVLVGRLSQWVFNHGSRKSGGDGGPPEFYYQVVISGSHDLNGRDRREVIAAVRDEMTTIWPAAREARLLRGRLVTDPAAVFSTHPGLEQFRPAQRTSLAGLFLAGDWTATGWPATMEGAVRSGYLAAEGVLSELGQPRPLLVPDLPRGFLARMAIRK